MITAPKFRSATIRDGTIRATTRSFLHALGQDDDDIARPHIGVFHTGGEMSRARLWKTPAPWSRPPADRPTPRCTCRRSRTRPASSFIWTTRTAAADGGPIAALAAGDMIAIDATAGSRSITVELAPEEIARRLAGRQVNAGVPRGGLLEKYALCVRPGHQGAVTHSGAVTWLRDES